MANRHWRPIHFAAHQGDTQAITALIAAKANPAVKDKHHETALHQAAKQGHLEAVWLLASVAPATVSQADNQGWPPHMWTKDEKVVRALVTRGADLNHKDKQLVIMTIYGHTCYR
jgi:cytohesin